MLKSLKIENFRGFESFELTRLGRINLLVGENNSGKTSVLEAIQLLNDRTNLENLHKLMVERGEFVENARMQQELEIRHLFNSRQLDQFIRIIGQYGETQENLAFGIREITESELEDNLGWPENAKTELMMHWSSNGIDTLDNVRNFILPVSSENRLLIGRHQVPRKLQVPSRSQSQFILVGSIQIGDLLMLFEQVQLTPQEELINQALRTIEPRCERIAGKVTQKRFEVKLSDQDQPIPLGSMGDGMSRILRLALGLANAAGGVLLVDEIDTGLHFTAMTGMWKMLWETCNKLDIQIFTTTHSRDCWESLAEVAESADVQDDEIMIHRIEKGKPASVAFNARQITIAAERGIEVR